jgi:uncharacterized protein YbjT (DUF2867 family)
VARILIVAGGCRGLELTRELVADGHAVRVTTRSESSRAAIEALGAECFLATPDRLATMRGALERVAVVCWLLAGATGGEDELRALHSSRLDAFVRQTIDTTVRGFVYERGAPGARASELLAAGERIARELAATNSIPFESLAEDISDVGAWKAAAASAIATLLSR